MARPFLNIEIEKLEAAFDRQRADPAFLDQLIHELMNRSSKRAARLQSRAVQARGMVPRRVAPSGAEEPAIMAPEARHQPDLPSDRPAQAADTSNSIQQPVAARRPLPPVENAPEAILSAWQALEVLSPPTFRRPASLAGGDVRAVAPVSTDPLPWDGAGEKARQNTRLYYQIVLGTIDMSAAIDRMMAIFDDSRADRPAAHGEAILACIMVDRRGIPIDDQAIAVSSFAWGLPRALSGDLTTLDGWQAAETSLAEELRKIIAPAEDASLPLTAAMIHQAFDRLLSLIELPHDLAKPPSFAIRSYQHFKNPEPPEDLLLNSFYLSDLALARDHVRQETTPRILRRYLGIDRPPRRQDLLRNEAALAAAISPGRFPAARWPGPGRYPLVLLRQAAVNLVFEDGARSSILAVNGPPGTGKTTLLRDIVAALMTERAQVMAAYADPAETFSHSGEKSRAGNAWIHLYRVDQRLRGFEVVVASSNNKAVENVSAELPAAAAVADDAQQMRYFSTVSDALLGRQTWGLIAAVLGNARNRARFREMFWWDDDVGLSTYLAAADGSPRPVQVTDPETGVVTTRAPRIVTEERAPRNHSEALERWGKSRQLFKAALTRSQAVLGALEKLRLLADSLPRLSTEADNASARQRSAVTVTEHAATELGSTIRSLASAQGIRDAAVADLQRHELTRPGAFARLLRSARFRRWREVVAAKRESVQRAVDRLDDAVRSHGMANAQHNDALLSEWEARRSLHAANLALQDATNGVEAGRAAIGERFVDDGFFRSEHGKRHVLAPWLDAAAHRARDDLFVAAVALHKAFVDAAAKPLRHNLGALMSAMSGRSLSTAAKQALLPDLWAALFLVVPVISTTFASVGRMLGVLPAETLGWLLIDEAGQASPQAAVGALMRTRHAVIVGDPVQIEPVVVLPDRLTNAICRDFGVDPDSFSAPAGSVQTLADAATPYFTEFAGRLGTRTVGVPLLVHRRCAEPMFGISNAIAYEGLMVSAKVGGSSAIRDLLGPSRWFHVDGSFEGKWCPQEGQIVVKLLRQLASAGIVPDLYVVTPFRDVQENLRRVILDSGLPQQWTGDPGGWVKERVGTVHVVQGREAEAVIFTLGAQAPQQLGARGWAGARPNLVNVAVTRAKEVLYVVGNRHLWRDTGVFRELHARMPPD